MAAADAIIARDGPVAAPMSYQVPAGAAIVPLCVTASFDGSGAAGSYVPCLEILTPDGKVLSRAVLQETIAAAEGADVTWFPGVAIAPPATFEQTVGVTSETLFVSSKTSTPTVGTVTLEAGVEYVIVVEGTWSFWNEALNVGTPDADAMFPTSGGGRVSTEVGVDADTLFAYPSDHPNTIGHQTAFQISLDGGATFAHLEPVGGPYTVPNVGHLYRFVVTGQGHPAQFKIVDTILYTDNYGELKVTLQVPSGTGTGSGAGSLVPPTDPTLDGDVLTVVSGLPDWAAPSGGGITTIDSPGGTITVTNPTGPTADLDLPASGVTPATYGDATHVPELTVDAEGRVTAVTNVAVIGGGGSAAGWQSGIPGVISATPVSQWTVHTNFGSAPLLLGARIIIPVSGTLHDIAVYIVSSSGNLDVGIIDTTATTRNRLYHSGAVACPAAGAWRIVADPALAVSAGDQYDIVVGISSTTASFMRILLDNNNMPGLPTGFDPAPGGGSPIMFWANVGVSTIPATIAESSLSPNANVLGVMARLA